MTMCINKNLRSKCAEALNRERELHARSNYFFFFAVFFAAFFFAGI